MNSRIPTMPIAFSLFAAASLVASSSPAALAQDGMPFRIVGPEGSGAFGRAVDAGGDVNGDGIGDILVVDPQWALGGEEYTTRIYIYSGVDASLIWDLVSFAGDTSPNADAVFLPDINGDGRDEVVVAVARSTSEGIHARGRIGVYSGADGTLLYERLGEAEFDFLGEDLAVTDDIDGDGFLDLIAVTRYTEDGLVSILSGLDGTTILDMPAQWPRRVDRLGDVNDDGISDVLIGLWGWGGGVGIDVRSGGNGGFLYHLDPEPSSQFGWMVAGGTDLNEDGAADFFANADPARGPLLFFSGRDGQLLGEIHPETGQSGFWLDVADIDGDGEVEWLDSAGASVGAYRFPSERLVRAFGTPGGSTVYGNENAASDINRDGFADLICGGDRNSAVFVFSGATLGLAGNNSYPLGVIRFDRFHLGRYSTLVTTDATPGRAVHYLYSTVGNDCTFVPRLNDCIDLSMPIQYIGRAIADENGVAEFRADIAPWFPQIDVWLQSVQLNHGSGGEPALSNVIEAQIVE